MVSVRGFGEQRCGRCHTGARGGIGRGVILGFRDAMGSGFDVSVGYRSVGIGVLNDP